MRIVISGIPIDVQKKNIKNMQRINLSLILIVYPMEMIYFSFRRNQ